MRVSAGASPGGCIQSVFKVYPRALEYTLNTCIQSVFKGPWIHFEYTLNTTPRGGSRTHPHSPGPLRLTPDRPRTDHRTDPGPIPFGLLRLASCCAGPIPFGPLRRGGYPGTYAGVWRQKAPQAPEHSTARPSQARVTKEPTGTRTAAPAPDLGPTGAHAPRWPAPRGQAAAATGGSGEGKPLTPARRPATPHQRPPTRSGWETPGPGTRRLGGRR